MTGLEFQQISKSFGAVRALAIETRQGWLEATRYLNMSHLKEHKKQALAALSEALTAAGPALRYMRAPRRSGPPACQPFCRT